MTGLRIRRVSLLASALVVTAASTLRAHDLFLKLETYFLQPHANVRVALLNGTFTKSGNAVTRDRVRDFRVTGPDTVYFPPAAGWHDDRDTTFIDFTTGGPGTYLIGVSTGPKEIALRAKEFNAYLKEEGVLDMLARRKATDELEVPARERYSKHVKAIIQVGDVRTSGSGRALDYAAEVVPLENPYALKVGDTFTVQCLVDGTPLRSHVVLAGYQTGKARPKETSLRTNGQGMASVRLTSTGRWYVKFVSMVRSADGTVDYESKWATLTWEVR